MAKLEARDFETLEGRMHTLDVSFLWTFSSTCSTAWPMGYGRYGRYGCEIVTIRDDS